MPRRRAARDSASASTCAPSEGSGSSADSTTPPPPPPGIDQRAKGPAGASPATPARAGTGAAGKQDEEEKPRQPALFHKTKMCKFNSMGACTRGEMCRFAHGKVDQNPLPDLSRTKLCKDLINTGQCNQPGCKFAHNKHELRKHPFVRTHDVQQHPSQQAGAQADAQDDKRARGAGLKTRLQKPDGIGGAPNALLGQEVAQLQANADLLWSDLTSVVSKMREKQLMQARLQQLQQAMPATLNYASDLGDALRELGERGQLDTWLQQSRAADAGRSPSDFGGLLGGGFGERGAPDPWAHSDLNLLSTGYLDQNGHSVYHPGGVDSTAGMGHLASEAVWSQDPWDASLPRQRAAPGLPGSSAAASALLAEARQKREKREKLLSPMYAPTMSMADPPPFSLA